jgi:hypothetical protein
MYCLVQNITLYEILHRFLLSNVSVPALIYCTVYIRGICNFIRELNKHIVGSYTGVITVWLSTMLRRV